MTRDEKILHWLRNSNPGDIAKLTVCLVAVPATVAVAGGIGKLRRRRKAQLTTP